MCCDLVRINGILCHEKGCTEAWKDTERECAWCGAIFTPTEKYQDCCCGSCAETYHQ
jgi:hypothetical protein